MCTIVLHLAWTWSSGVVWVVGFMCCVGAGGREGESARVFFPFRSVSFRFVFLFGFFLFFVSPVFLACLSAGPFWRLGQWAISGASRRRRGSGARPASRAKSGDGGSATGRGHGRSARRRTVQFNVRHRLRLCSM